MKSRFQILIYRRIDSMAKKINTIDELDPQIKQHIREVLASAIARHIVQISIDEVVKKD